MKNNNYIILIFLSMFFLHSCGGGLSDAGKVLRNEKIRTSDEFLVKKRDPLTLPPDFRNLPEPNSLKKSKNDKKDALKSILDISKDNSKKSQATSTVEQSIINKIGK